MLSLSLFFLEAKPTAKIYTFIVSSWDIVAENQGLSNLSLYVHFKDGYVEGSNINLKANY